jgi:ribose transport system substrate-binding protein
MKRMLANSKALIVHLLILTLCLALFGCGQQPQQASSPAGSTDAKKEEAKKESSPGAAGPKKVVIGLSNGLFGTDWRTQMVESAQKAFDDAKSKGIIANDSELKIQHAGADINQQIQQIRNMINEKVNVIMVNANSATALNSVFEEAKKAGIPVISFDQAVTSPWAYNVTVDHYQWGKRYAEWLAKALNGKGKIVMMDGIAGHPAAEARKKAAEDVFKNYPDIEILQKVSGGWDQAKAQATMSDLLAANPKIDGVFVEDSMAMGVLRAFQTAGRDVPVMTGETMYGYLKMWKELKAKEVKFDTFGQANPPGISASAMQVAVRVATGKKLKTQPNNTFFYPISKTVDNSNFDEISKSMDGKKDTYFLDEWLSDEQADKLFE